MSIIEGNLSQTQSDLQASIAESRDFDYKRTFKCLLVLFIALSIAALIYFFLHSRMYALGVLGVAVLGLSFYHTPFAFMFLFFFFPLESAYSFSQIGLGSRIIGLIIVVSYLVTRFRGKLIISKSFIPIFIFNLFAILSIIWAVNPSASIEGIKSLTLNVIMIFILVNTIKDLKQMRMLLWAILIGGIISSVMIVQVQASFAQGGEKLGRVILADGTSPNVLGNSILISFLAGFYLFNEKGIFNKIIFILTGPLMLYAILNTQNRTALGTAVLAPLVAFLMSARGKYLIKNILGILLVCMAGYGLFYVALNTDVLSEMAKARLRSSENDLSQSGRVDQWKTGLEFLSQRPINGWGWKNFSEKFPLHKTVRSAHNNIVAIAGELGVIGLLIWISIYLVILTQTFKLSHPPLRWLAIAFLVYTLITGITSTTIITKGYWYAVGFALLGCNVSGELDIDEKRISETNVVKSSD